MIERLIDSTIPIPLGLVVKKALNSFSAVSESIPRDPACQPARPPSLRQAESPNGAALAHRSLEYFSALSKSESDKAR